MNGLQPYSDARMQKKNVDVTQRRVDYGSDDGCRRLWTHLKFRKKENATNRNSLLWSIDCKVCREVFFDV